MFMKLIESLTKDIINLFEIQIPIENMNDVVDKLGGRVEESYMGIQVLHN